ncbi:NAD-dependent epimerase/dehydratase family protein [Cellulomonas sp. URHE0023]|uniref:NAD-dependent epimerase/dehydratase family protein n=1 Tax=Cellulomonas sp. URHE0023 TaxID=1380354 RepID=UPI0006924D0C|nr:NAD-dependent epimerase/dehydratase family protein [Cellulomonas sp. URHE0023]
MTHPTGTHVVLGGNGVVGRETVRALLDRGHDTVSVGRAPSSRGDVRSVTADLLEADDVDRALRGADVAYLVVGLPYSARVWEKQWPLVARNTIAAALTHGTHLVVLDNVYAYGPFHGPITPDLPLRPSTRKGWARAAVLHALDEAAEVRGLVKTVAHSADFYGPGATTSVFTTFAIDRIVAGKKATWFFDATQPHSLTYVPDIADALAVLGTDDRARGRVWHVPTAPALTGQEYVAIAGGRCTTMSMTTMRIGALFSTPARETLEMAYQYTAPYLFDSSEFERTFDVAPTPYDVGIAASLAAARATAKPA